MVQQQNILRVPTIWRGNKFVLELNSEASVSELGKELLKLTDVKADTMRLIVPQSSRKSSMLLMPFSDEHSSIRLQDAGVIDGKPLRMMGVLENEVDQLMKDSQAKFRIAGFEEEERRMKERLSRGPLQSLKLPKGPYTFGGFRTLELPGIELNPPPSEALKRMHMLASDPGIIAIMNKHRWRVGIMTEMAPVGYVGISPVCLLGVNKNHGEEISLRLRTDDLKGFRQYERVKKVLLHELAHMVHSEHDENFYALDKQLNQEASALDWTQSTSHTLANTRHNPRLDDLDMDFELESSLPQKVGGETSVMPASARVAAVNAAYNRLAESSVLPSEPLPYNQHTDYNKEVSVIVDNEKGAVRTMEPDPDETKEAKNGEKEDISQLIEADVKCDQPDEYSIGEMPDGSAVGSLTYEPDPDEELRSEILRKVEVEFDNSDECNTAEMPDTLAMDAINLEPDPDDEELRRVQDPVNMFCDRLAKAIEMLNNELNPSEVAVIQQTLFKIIRNVSENPNELKYKRLRKANPVFQRSIANSKAAMEILFLIGFADEVVTDEIGRAETYLVLKRNDPGLIWLAKSTLGTTFARS